MDVTSIMLSAFAFGGLIYGLATIGTLIDGASMVPVVALVIGVVGLAMFAMRQIRLQRSGSALLDLRPLAVPNFRISVVIVMIGMATMLGTVMVLPIYLQAALGISVLTTGLLLLPGGLARGAVTDRGAFLRQRRPTSDRDPPVQFCDCATTNPAPRSARQSTRDRVSTQCDRPVEASRPDRPVHLSLVAPHPHGVSRGES